MKLQIPNDKDLAIRVVEAQSEQMKRNQEVGLVGKVFGDASNKSGNIAGLSVLASFLLFACVLIWGEDTASLTKKDALLLVSSFVTLTLGNLFGQSSANKNR